MHELYDQEILARPGKPAIYPPRLGIIGGGQLARMTALAAMPLGCDVVVLERNPFSPAARLSPKSMVGDWNDPAVQREFASRVDVITLENEFVDADALRAFERMGLRLLPTADSLEVTQDKLKQKQTLAGVGLPVPRFQSVASPGEILDVAEIFGWPLVLKTRRNGYDGKGNFTIRSPRQVTMAWESLRAGRNELYVEAFCTFARELAVIITRAPTGQTAVYPVVETIQSNHICNVVKAPAEIPLEIATRAAELARCAVESVGGLGSFGVELFLQPDGRLLINELAPRVHNSGHYTIEACVCSQFENHVRAVLGLPLGSTAMIAPAAAMVNVLGSEKAPGQPLGLSQALTIPGAHVHLYGKAMSGPGRKMGHVTALGRTLAEALDSAETAAKLITFRTASS